jgi:hypothetical protein
MKLYLPLLCIIFIFVQTVTGQEWKNIIPLKTTKAEIEKILGLPIEKVKYGEYGFTYTSAEGKINVFYASERCKGEIRGWNVETDTVLTFTLFPKDSRMINYREIRERTQDFILILSDTLANSFIDPEKGTDYVFSDGELVSITIAPKSSDNHLRCKGFPTYNLAGASYIPSDYSYRKTDLRTAKDNIDPLILTMPKGAKVYIVAYSGSNLSGKKYDNYLQQIKRYIRSRKEVDHSRVVVIDGGKRKQFGVELYFISKDYPPPMPQPDL